MSARLSCRRCRAFRTPDEVDFDHVPVRCKACGAAIEVFDEQLEALDKQLAVGGRESEMLEIYPAYPIYPRETPDADTSEPTPLVRLLQFILGSRESITRSTSSGMVSGFVMTLFFVGAAQLDLGIDGLSFLGEVSPTTWVGLVCFPFLFALIGGRPMGWLLVRPLAGFLQVIYPGLDPKRVWMISTTAVWLPIAILALYPYQQLPPALEALLLVAAAVWVVIAGVLGGYRGAAVEIGSDRADWREGSAIGGSVTGSLLYCAILLVSLVLSPATRPGDGSGGVAELVLFLAGIAFVSMIPFAITWPLLVVTSKLIGIGREVHLSYVLFGGALWAAIGYLAGTHMLTNSNVVAGLTYAGLVGLCGACGGWAIGEFRPHT